MQNALFAMVVNGTIFGFWLILLVKDRKKGILALQTGTKIILEMLPLILMVIGLLGVISSFISQEQISSVLGDQSGWKGVFYISVISSFLQIPEIIIFPVASTLLENGASVTVVAVFACASSMASIVTLPMEIKYLGKTIPFIRIFLTYLISICVGVLTGAILRISL